MPTSGSIDLTATGTDIITEALELLGVLSEGQAPTTNQETSCLRTLNYLVKAWQAEGLNLFALQKTFLFLERSIQEYTLDDVVSASNWTTSFNSTQVDGDEAAAETTITVDDASSISNGDFIGIELDDGTMHWTTVNGAPVGNDVTITDALPSQASDRKYVYSYTTRAGQPLKIDYIVVRDVQGTDIPVDIVPLEEYARLTPKDVEGRVLEAYFDPQRTEARLSVWPTTNSVTDYLVCWVHRKLEDVDAVGDEVDFPQEWFLPLAYNLAVTLLPKYPNSPGARAVSELALYWKRVAEGWDSEDGFILQPGTEYNRD